MSQSRFGWALGVVAPWCLGMGLLVSFTAAAGHDASTGASVARLASRAPGGTDALVPSMPSATLAERLRRPLLASLNTAALSVGDPRDLPSRPDEVDPRRDLKKGAGAFPTPDRTRRGDPAISLRPTFDAKLRSKGGAAAQFDGLLFNGLDYLAFDGFNGAGGDGTGSTSPAGPARALISPAPRRAIEDGSTPAIPRAVSLSSSTPVQPDHAPIEVLAAAHVPVLGRADTTVVPASPKPDYAALIDPANTKAELRCLAEAVYFEARSEPEEGQAAVAASAIIASATPLVFAIRRSACSCSPSTLTTASFVALPRSRSLFVNCSSREPETRRETTKTATIAKMNRIRM